MSAMISTLLFALALSDTALPKPLSPTHLRDIACVAAIGLVAHDQRSGLAEAKKFPDFSMNGKTWGGIVGDRVTQETGQPREVVAAEIQAAVQREQRLIAGQDVTAEMKIARVQDCATLMNGELLDQPLPKPVRTPK